MTLSPLEGMVNRPQEMSRRSHTHATVLTQVRIQDTIVRDRVDAMREKLYADIAAVHRQQNDDAVAQINAAPAGISRGILFRRGYTIFVGEHLNDPVSLVEMAILEAECYFEGNASVALVPEGWRSRFAGAVERWGHEVQYGPLYSAPKIIGVPTVEIPGLTLPVAVIEWGPDIRAGSTWSPLSISPSYHPNVVV